MSETESMPTEWNHFYQQNLGLVGTNMFGDAGVSEATAVTATTVSSSGSAALSPDGRVAKPIRRRSRASRRTPTTLLNTDTTNFRAMVQQFTGGPAAASFASTGPQQMGLVGQHGGPMMPGPGSFHLPYHQQQRLQQQQQQQQQNQTASYMFSLSPGDQLLLQTLGNNSGVDGVADGFGEVAPPVSRRGSSSVNGNGSGNSFLF